MYRCQNCNVVVGPGHKLNRVVIETRPKTYPIFRQARRRRGPAEPEAVASATGFEIAKELQVCSNCATELADKAESVTTPAG